MSGESMAAQYAREMMQDPPPPLAVRYFYTSPLAIDDPLSPLPPPVTASTLSYKHPPRPFSAYDNHALDKAWLDVRRKRLKIGERGNNEKRWSKEPTVSSGSGTAQDTKRGSLTNTSAAESKRRSLVGSIGADSGHPSPRQRPQRMPSNDLLASTAKARAGSVDHRAGDGSLPNSLRMLDPADGSLPLLDTASTTGNPFIRAPLRMEPATSRSRSASLRPNTQKIDSYNWGDDHSLKGADREIPSRDHPKAPEPSRAQQEKGPSATVPVGISRLHEVALPDLQMEPIYWSPVNDIASVVRGTWFYKDNMLPVEVDVANMLEAGYVELRAWSQTWVDELNSAAEVGAAGEMKILHKLWPDRPKKVPSSRPGTSRGQGGGQMLTTVETEEVDPEKEQQELAEHAGDLIDISSGKEEADHKAAGSAPYGKEGTPRKYLSAGVIYANDQEAYMLSPSLQPSVYYGRRPLSNYIRKGHRIGIQVVRGFDQQAWNKLHPPKKLNGKAERAREGVSASEGGVSAEERQRQDPSFAQSERPNVTDLVFVIHGIGQKLSERVESYHFTHAINSLRREVNVELGTDSVKAHLRPEQGGIMVLPVNWRLTLDLAGGTAEASGDGEEDLGSNSYTLADITPDTLTSVRGIVSDVMLDIPYYLSREYNPQIIAAVIREANKIYRLWCANNPGFADYGRVHIIAHSLGSVMAVDVLSQQPTHIPADLVSKPVDQLPTDHFIFDTKNLFLCGSPCGFFLLLKKSSLLPRRERNKPGADSDTMPGVAGEQGTYGCLAVDNIYNIINPYDPVAYRLNAAVDVDYASQLKQAWVPARTSGWFSFGSTPNSKSSANLGSGSYKPGLVSRLPSNVELETHNFTREEIAERRAFLLNDNGQIDYFLKYGGGTFEIQYLTMLGAHSSYWISRDFVGFIVQEVGRRVGREGVLGGMGAQKKKKDRN
ncbi:hypothetical protein Vi05172_g4396 [Venturia inaequalis]|nr:hypothetical protein Vi05172_g4396 [Venturia inaequalis]